MLSLLAYIPFRDAIPIHDYWVWLIIPLCLAVAIVYKTVRAEDSDRLAKDAIIAAAWILAGLAGGAAALALVVSFLVR